MIQVINGEITQYGLPETGVLKDGRTVSGYNLLDSAILADESWLPLEDVEPIYDSETHYLVDDGYEILKTKVKKKYQVVEKPEPQIPQIILLQRQIEELRQIIDILLGGEDNE